VQAAILIDTVMLSVYYSSSPPTSNYLQDHHGIQTLIRSVEDELADVDRCELKSFVEDSCGIGNVDVDAVADVVLSSAMDVDCGRKKFSALARFLPLADSKDVAKVLGRHI
jgi:L-asparaginase II